ncbi:hypothetical protein HW090_13860 [Pseudomonas sp. ABC1]|uniref:hypothetical protein n=1 Tax=Pseudomonas sp. ABC1 TaxID=2748080 RepID=UPI0015C300B4|nr:hypothetical protein [Pseudomonas sp. ABC1]QLF94221.1 hypothetical protein HW090_13860 [Pseudomonas sp. ABC1]
MTYIRSLRTAVALITAAALSVGCSFHGSYPDSTAPDAAKLRFISDMDSATLSLLDAEHCDGRTTGLLNNLFAANTKRRAEMRAAPPADAKAYLEIRLEPGQETLLLTNSVSTGSVCGGAFNFTPQSGSEYELTFNYAGSKCVSALKRLDQVQGKVVRTNVILVNKGLPSCAGRNALFPKAPETLPDTPERAALIDRIIDESIIEKMKAGAEDNTEKAGKDESIEKNIVERKAQIGFALPETYWTEYRDSMERFARDVSLQKSRALQRYKDDYRTRLRQLDTEQIKELAPDSETADLGKMLTTNNLMLQHYERVSRDLIREALSEHINRMADLDRRYSVCERFPKCWKN